LHHPKPFKLRQRFDCLPVLPVGQHEGGGVASIGQPPHVHPSRGELGGHVERASCDGGDHASHANARTEREAIFLPRALDFGAARGLYSKRGDFLAESDPK
jgi:hypothetical protein